MTDLAEEETLKKSVRKKYRKYLLIAGVLALLIYFTSVYPFSLYFPLKDFSLALVSVGSSLTVLTLALVAFLVSISAHDMVKVLLKSGYKDYLVSLMKMGFFSELVLVPIGLVLTLFTGRFQSWVAMGGDFGTQLDYWVFCSVHFLVLSSIFLLSIAIVSVAMLTYYVMLIFEKGTFS